MSGRSTSPQAESASGGASGLDPAGLFERLRLLLETARSSNANGSNDKDAHTHIVTKTEQPTDAHINRVAFKPPQPLYLQNPTVWFNILEQQFKIADITKEDTKYSHAVSALDSRLHNTFASLILRDKGDTSYTTFRDEVIRVLGESKKTKINNLLHGLSLGDRKPSQLLSEFRLNAGGDFADKTLQQMWMTRLPQQVQMVLTPFENDVDLNTLAERADAVMETMSHSRISAVDSIPPQVQSTSDVTLQAPNIEALLARFRDSIISEVSQLVAAGGSSSGGSRSRPQGISDRQHSHSRSSSRRRLNPKFEICYYHHKFGDKAQKCVTGCTFRTKSGKGDGQTQGVSGSGF